jgi:hypothetical protein
MHIMTEWRGREGGREREKGGIKITVPTHGKLQKFQ